MIGVLVAIAVATVLLTAAGMSHISQPTPLVTGADPSTVYGPHDYGATSPTAARSAVGVTANNQDSPVYTKAELYTAARSGTVTAARRRRPCV
jgi:hypothetical protein